MTCISHDLSGSVLDPRGLGTGVVPVDVGEKLVLGARSLISDETSKVRLMTMVSWELGEPYD